MKRPVSITIIAWLFIIVGLLSAWDIISGFWEKRISLNFGVLFIFLGRGLLRLQPAALTWALAITFLGWIGLAVFMIISLFGEVRFGNEVLTGAPRLFVLLGFAIIYGAILTWMTVVLRRKEIEDLFRGSAA